MRHNSEVVGHRFCPQVMSNRNLKIEMHSFVSQDMSQR